MRIEYDWMSLKLEYECFKLMYKHYNTIQYTIILSTVEFNLLCDQSRRRKVERYPLHSCTILNTVTFW